MRPRQHESRHFSIRIFLTRIRVNGALKHSGERFPKDAVSVVSGFTDFVWASSHKNSLQFQKYSDSC